MRTSRVKRAKWLAKLMDEQFDILGICFGLDGLVGLFPGVGDWIGFLIGVYIVWLGYQMELPKYRLVQMLLNLFLDTMVGMLPLVGDVGDVWFKANSRNVRILERYGEILE